MMSFKRGERGFTLIELLIVVAILGVLAAVVIPNVVGLMGRGGKQALNTDAQTIQLATSTFYSDVHGGFVAFAGPVAGTLFPVTQGWGCNVTVSGSQPSGHYYPNAIGVVGNCSLVLDLSATDPNQITNPQIDSSQGTAAVDADISNAAIWMGLLVNAPGAVGGTSQTSTLPSRGNVSALATDTGLYLQNMPKSASAAYNGANLPGGGYTWVVGANGSVYSAYKNTSTGKWYSGFSGSYP